MIHRFLLLPLGCVLLNATLRAETLTYPQLVQRMTDLPALALLPTPGEKTALASSYDRRSEYDASTDKYIKWGANDDGIGVIRQEGDESVLMDVQGPGCIWRTWAATASAGHVKIYLDGSPTPTVDLPFSGYFDGKTAPFNRSNLVYIASAAAHGFNNYTPIPFQKSCKIVGEKGWGSYYQFNYTQFPAGTVVPTFGLNLSPDDAAALDQTDKLLGQCGQPPLDGSAQARTESKTVSAAAGKTVTVADLNGAGAITALKMKLDLPADAEAQRNLLHQLTVSITWDGDTKPAVWSTLGDFFAYVGGADKFRSLPVGYLQDGTFYSYWYMPYERKAHIEVGNDSPMPVAMNWEITSAPLVQPIAKLARFHAKWHRDAFLPTRADRAPDWTLLVTQGRGRFVGTHLHGWTPKPGWWGEGDEKFFVDGEKFPSTFGTGSEDYFGYAWSSSGHFSRAYHNQILNESNAGHFDDNRWHISDSVPFGVSFEADMEKYFPNDRPNQYAAEVFWYLEAGGDDPYPPVPLAERIGYWKPRVVYREPNVIEGESLVAGNKLGQDASVLDMMGFGTDWSGDAQLFWQAHHVGETLDVPLPAQPPGRYRLIVQYSKSYDFGIVQTGLNGVDIGQPVDLYDPKLSRHEPTDLGIVTLPAGKSVLKMTIVGKNDVSKGTKCGLDYLKLVPAP